METLTTIFYFLITIGILVLVHELGHFIAARLTGMRVERFSIGFPPRAFGKKIGDTDYCISWIPIGGYVKIAGMIDESMDTEFVNKPPEPWEFRSKPFLSKFFVMIAGVLMNIILAVIIFWGINYSQGKFLKETNQVSYVVKDSPADKIGLKVGDKILKVGEKEITHWDQINEQIFLKEVGLDVSLKILRENSELELTIPYKELKTYGDDLGIFPEGTATLITGVEPQKPAEALGLKPGDILLTINKENAINSALVKSIIESNANKDLSISWLRNSDTLTGIVRVTEEGRIGVGLGTIFIGPKKQIAYSFFEAFSAGVNNITGAMKLFAYSIKQIIAGKQKFSQSFGGPIKIAQMATQSAEMGWISFLAFMGLLSISLAIINIIPFPALDGGHILFLVIELIIRRELPAKVKMAIQQVGFYMLLALMAYVIYNDIVNF